MTWIVRIGGILLGIAVAAFLVAIIGGRFSDGPVEIIPGVPGGPLSGEIESGPEPEWSFVRDRDTIELQIDSSPPRSIFTGVVVYADSLYVPVTLSPLKRWPAVVSRNPYVIMRVDGRLFERQAVPVTEPKLHEHLKEIGQSKYGPPYHARWAARFTHYLRLEPLIR